MIYNERRLGDMEETKNECKESVAISNDETRKEHDSKIDKGEAIEANNTMIEDGVHNYSRAERYVAPKEVDVQKQLEWFQDQKLALMMHWGIYSQLGIVESWALSDEDAPWSRNCIDWEVDGEEFKKEYFDLNKTFNPVRFNPKEWAEIASDAGFKYFIFTTKHHDGFCMWDTKYSDYKVTNEDCPFHKHKYSNITYHLFEEMRKKELGIAAYFSKADWHIPYYWSSSFENGSYTSRNPSYDPEIHKEVWEKFAQFTRNQILELATEYGKLDVLWFDAGWVCKENGQDIRLGEIMDEVRLHQPWVLSADRTVGGPYENYVTPEQCIPNEPLLIPWESCITIGTSFSFKYEDEYKTPRELVKLLVDVVAKGGNLALNVGPQPDGRIPEGAKKSMKGLGEWMRLYGEAIYGTRPCAPYKKNGIAFTRKNNNVYAIKIYEENDEILEEIIIPFSQTVFRMKLLGVNIDLSFDILGDGYKVVIPKMYIKKELIGCVIEMIVE